MSTRLRMVHPADMVAHLWANQSQPTAYTASRNFYYDGSTIYSYGSHFPVARHVTLGKGKRERRCILFNSRSYSNTTNKHQSLVRHAITGDVPIFTVPFIEGMYGTDLTKERHTGNLEHYQKCIVKLTTKAKRARSRGDTLIREATQTVTEANEYAVFFGLRKRFSLPSDTDIAKIKADAERAKIKDAKLLEERRKEHERKQAAYQVELREAAERWRAGEDVRNDFYSLPVMLRIRGSYVQSSKGAVVPIEDAKRLLPLIRAGREWHRNGQTMAIGSFELNEVTTGGNIRVGCHFIERDELERIAAQLGI